MKQHLNSIFLLIVSVIGVLFAVTVFFNDQNAFGGGIFTTIGAGAENVKQESNLIDISVEQIEDTKETLKVSYVGGIKNVGESYSFKEMFLVKDENGNELSLDDNDELILYLVDAKDSSGASQLKQLSTLEIMEMEEISAAIVYDKELQVLHLHKSGVFNVYIKIYTKTGSAAFYEFKLPVEVE